MPVVLWFLLLAAGVVVLATWAAGTLAARQERENTDTRLAANLRVASDEFGQVLDEAEGRAEQLAGQRNVQRALETQNRAAARRIVSAQGGDIALVGPTGVPLAGRANWPANRSVDVTGAGGRALGQVVVGAPLNDELAERLAAAAGVVDGDALAIAAGTRIVASDPQLRGQIPTESPGTVELGGEDYRYLSSPLISGTDVRLSALGSEEPITTAASDARRRALFASLAAVAALALLAWATTTVLRRRAAAAPVPDEQGRRATDARDEREAGARVREAVALVGEALAATHDPEALLPVILQSAIGATGAAGARLVSDGTEIARAGDPDSGGSPLLLRLGGGEEVTGQLLLYPPPDGQFDEQAQELAHWLAAQASIALDNERLHRAVKRQAITDELTQLANRRSFAQTLGLEVRRAERFGDPLTLVLADIDDFKRINDEYGHPMGDVVLRSFAEVLRANVRDFDVPARYGGEEFAILLPETELAGGERLARRLLEALAKVRVAGIAGDRAPVTASFGVASFPRARNAEELLAAADRALYRAKGEGKNQVALD